MSYVSVDVDLDEFETYELCEELSKRLKSFGRKKPTEKEKKEIISDIDSLLGQLNLSMYGLPTTSLDDKLKIEFLSANWDKFTSWQMEEALKPIL